MREDLLRKIAELKARFSSPATPDDLSVVEGWERDALKSLLIENLAEHDGMKPLLDGLRSDVAGIHEVLLTADSKTLSDSERDRLLDKKELYTRVLSYFSGASENLAAIEREINANTTT